MNRLSPEKRMQIAALLVEGNSIRATCRLSGAAKGTVLKLLADLGRVCADYQDRTFRNLTCRKVQIDEVWAFVGAKEKNVPAQRKGEWGVGDVWTFVALDADTKLTPCWLVARRDAEWATFFLKDLASRVSNRIQLTTDGFRAYMQAVERVFGDEIDYAQLVKIYGPGSVNEGRYSPAKCIGAIPTRVNGTPEPRSISTSYVERNNLTMRMSMRRFTRLTNAFSKKIENLEYALALHFMHYNFCRVHKTLKTTPAVAAGITDHVWSLEEVVELLVTAESN